VDNAVNLKVTVKDEGGTVVENAQVAIYKADDMTQLVNDDTDEGAWSSFISWLFQAAGLAMAIVVAVVGFSKGDIKGLGTYGLVLVVLWAASTIQAARVELRYRRYRRKWRSR